MRTLRYFLFLILFGISLLLSRQVSLAIFHPQIQIEPIASTPDLTEIAKPLISEQLNLLILHVPSLDDQQLISAWWVAIAPRSPISIVNLYPTAQANGPESSLLQQNYSLQSNQVRQYELNPGFLRQLRIRNIPWDGYIVMDHDSLAVLVDYLGGVNLYNEQLDGTEVIARMSQVNQAPEINFDFQNKLWEAICQKSIFASSPASFELVRPALQQHTVLSSQFPITLEDFHIFNSNTDQISCKVSALENEQSYMLPYRNYQSSQEK